MLGQRDKQFKRDKVTLMIEVLKNIREPTKKTHLLYKAGVNFHQLDRYLGLLLSIGLVRTVTEPFNGYQITEKGIQFLDLFDSGKLPNMDIPSGAVTQVIDGRDLTE
jgi:predicted transcriptional regulator